jgi:hypothetical protein
VASLELVARQVVARFELMLALELVTLELVTLKVGLEVELAFEQYLSISAIFAGQYLQLFDEQLHPLLVASIKLKQLFKK